MILSISAEKVHLNPFIILLEILQASIISFRQVKGDNSAES